MEHINFKKLSVSIVICILLLTILEFPAPVGFETRPQDNVSKIWLILFLTILAAEITAIPLIIKYPRIGAIFGMAAAFLNIVQIFADQLHLMQPEKAPLGYLLLEDTVGFLSLALAYFSYQLRRINTKYLRGN